MPRSYGEIDADECVSDLRVLRRSAEYIRRRDAASESGEQDQETNDPTNDPKDSLDLGGNGDNRNDSPEH